MRSRVHHPCRTGAKEGGTSTALSKKNERTHEDRAVSAQGDRRTGIASYLGELHLGELHQGEAHQQRNSTSQRFLP